ncbi:Fe-S protein assembly co-chaperone HscB [Candidatus Tisiphia endosymbiont of Nemotelus uliginosus]|uniref:Fe-S protein assembly co-chaperone HscB n=1 Tax=Candidatus Tisiphia endosymbiont of Nemotelus uliginosus TaxID=3077926 RepID=UPI0035C8F57B
MISYFALLDIEQKYDIDLNTLNIQYFAMQLKYHPDKAQNIQEKQNNLAISIDLNKAYQMLKDDLLRAEHLLLLNNIHLNEPYVRQGLKAEQLNDIWCDLELVENTQELLELEHILEKKVVEQEQLLHSLTDAFKKQNMQSALDFTIKLKYLKNVINSIQLKINSCK